MEPSKLLLLEKNKKRKLIKKRKPKSRTKKSKNWGQNQKKTVSVETQTHQYIHPVNQPKMQIDSYTTYNLRIQIRNPVHIIGKIN